MNESLPQKLGASEFTFSPSSCPLLRSRMSRASTRAPLFGLCRFASARMRLRYCVARVPHPFFCATDDRFSCWCMRQRGVRTRTSSWPSSCVSGDSRRRGAGRSDPPSTRAARSPVAGVAAPAPFNLAPVVRRRCGLLAPQASRARAPARLLAPQASLARAPGRILAPQASLARAPARILAPQASRARAPARILPVACLSSRRPLAPARPASARALEVSARRRPTAARLHATSWRAVERRLCVCGCACFRASVTRGGARWPQQWHDS